MFLTHSHWDHIGTAHQFDDVVINKRERTNGKVTIDGLSPEFVARPTQFVVNWHDLGRSFPDGFDLDTYNIPPTDGVGVVEHGDMLSVGDRQLELLSIPGHSPGQLVALDHETGVLYGADAIGIDRSLYAHFETRTLRHTSIR